MSTHKYNCGHETFWEDDRTIIIKENLLCPMCKVYAESRVTRREGMTRNSKTLASFVKYCEEHPYERFWQALRNWSRYNFIFVTKGSGFNRTEIDKDCYDTFDWEGRRHDDTIPLPA